MTLKKLRFDLDSLTTDEPKSSADLKAMKAELDSMSKLLESGKATTLDKENFKTLNSALKESLATRTVAEKALAGGVDTKELLKEKQELSALMEELKSLDKGSAEYTRAKARASKLKDSMKDSLEVATMRKRLERRTEIKVGVKTQIERNLEAARKARKVVVCFMVDCTASMDSYINGVKDQIQSVARDFVRLYSESSMHFAFLGYRDFGDTEQFEIFDFVESVKEFEDFVSMVKAEGGGDTAEDVVGALTKAQHMNWDIAGAGSSRILVHIADAPAHGSKYHNGVSDNYADKDTPNGAEGKNATPPLRYLKAKQVHYFFCRVNDSCDKMVDVFNRDVGSEYVVKRELANVTLLSDTVLKTLSTSVMRTVASARADATHKLSTGMTCISEGDEDDDGASTICEPSSVKTHTRSEVDFSRIAVKTVKVYQCKPPHDLTSLQNGGVPLVCQAMFQGRDGCTSIRSSEQPFAKGSVRWAFYGQLLDGENWQPFVMKRLQGPRHPKVTYCKAITESAIAAFLARQYNARRGGGKAIRFLNAMVLESQENGSSEYYFAEPELPLPSEKFRKWANNAGDWDVSILEPSLLEFAKYTYDATNGYYMVSDLQGVETESEFVLTDPAILSKNIDMFGGTNLGPRAMQTMYEVTRVLLQRFPWFNVKA